MKPVFTAACSALVAVAASAPASAHRIDAHLSQGGLDFLEAQIPTYVPEDLEVGELSREFGEYEGGPCMTVTQRDTVMNVEVHEVSVSMPGDGMIRVALDVSGRAAGEMSFDGIYGCVGEEICRDDVTIENARAIADFQIEVAQGEPTVSVHNVDLELAEEDLSVRFSECGIDDAANSAVEFARDTLLDVILAAAENLAEQRLAPRIEELLAGFATYDADLGPADVALEIASARAETGGMFLSADVDATSRYPAAECLGGDPGDPDTQVAEAPDLAAGVSAHLGVAVNLGLLDDALYHVWRAGLMCMTDDHLTDLGVEIDLDRYAGGLLPGFSPGTDFGLELSLARPPKLVASESGDARISLVAERVQADLTGRGPDGDVGELHAEIDLEASARVAVDRATNSLVLAIEGAEISRLHLEDEIGSGVDPARLEQIIEEQVLPTALADIGEIPVTGSIFGVTDYYVLLREVRTTDAYLAAKVDLFRAPEDDTGTPDTRLESRPEGLVTPEDAVLRASGADDEIPTELLRYRAIVDGEDRGASFLRDITVGTPGETATHEVIVRAVDLAGNEDPTPVELEVMVDGISPHVDVDGGQMRRVSVDTATVTWEQSDDLTGDAALVPRVEIHRVENPGDVLDAQLIDSAELSAGATSHEVSLEPGEIYRVEIHVRDEAGNETVSSTLLSMDSGGCAASGTGAGPTGAGLLLAIAAAAAALRRRRAR